MRIPKQYGSSKTSTCAFCGRQATQNNEQGLEVCPTHRQSLMEDIKCRCGAWLEFRSGKFGPYFNCLRCGNLNYARVMEMRTPSTIPVQDKTTSPQPKEITITSHDVDYFE